MKIDGSQRTTVADTRGAFESFGFRPPAINNGGDVAFHATLDDFVTSGSSWAETRSRIGRS